jgi:predicted amidohydrolase
MRPDIGNVEVNRSSTIAYIKEASDNGANLIVLPELSNTGYVFNSKAEADLLAEDIDSSETVRLWAAICKERQVYLVGGLAEKHEDKLYNSAVLVGPDGLIGKYRKNHLWNKENEIFEPGNLGYPVFETELGMISVSICFDGWFPETYRVAALSGADIVCVPTNWIPMQGHRDDSPAMATILTRSGAHSNSIFIAAADRVGIERGQKFIGQSLIVSFTGEVISGLGSADQEEILYADIDLSEAKASRQWNDYNHPLENRRVETYVGLSEVD